jgi:capsular polysaccharide biosynthesis protein
MDFGSAIFINTLFKSDDREIIKTDSCIVLWSHYWGDGFYDYLLFVYAKLLRIKSAIGEAEFKKCKIIYPLIGTGFEIELIKYAGIDEYQLIDSRAYTIEANNYYLANNDNWYYHNRHDLQLICETLEKVKNTGPTNNERIYISRKGRRRVLNEPEVVAVLKEFDFTILYDEPRLVAEQVTLYRNAKVIIGPHGASFANILNCKPGTILIELFPDDYHPDYFRFMSHIFGLNYFAIFENGVVPTEYWQVNENMTIDTEKVRSTLQKILG